MKKSDVIDLIKAYTNNNRTDFVNKSMDIASDFRANGDTEISNYIMFLLSDNLNMLPPENADNLSSFFAEIKGCNQPLYLPREITDDLLGIIQATKKEKGLNKYLFIGKPGTGKTEAVKELGQELNRTILSVNFNTLVDSALGQTNKNIVSLFREIDNLYAPSKYLILFDEIDALALDRINSNDVREMGRATSTLLKCLDSLNSKVLLIATTNLYDQLDKALVRRFDATISFDNYSVEDKAEIANNLVTYYQKGNSISKDERLLTKIITLTDKPSLTPGVMKNVIRTSIAFSSEEDKTDYLRRIFEKLSDKTYSPDELKDNGFTVREIGVLTKTSKSTVSRQLRGDRNE